MRYFYAIGMYYYVQFNGKMYGFTEKGSMYRSIMLDTDSEMNEICFEEFPEYIQEIISDPLFEIELGRIRF